MRWCEPKNRERGAVYVEFLIVVFPMLFLMFGLAHIGFAYTAHLLVGHATARAARAAIVILPDETDEYAGVALNRIGTDGEGLEAYKNAPEDGRYDQIRMAARITLSPLSPAIESYVGDSLADAIGDHPGVSTLAGLIGPWTDQGVALTFPDGNGGYLTEFSPRQDITVRITYLYKCSVPIVRSLVCRSYSDLDDRAKKELEAMGAKKLLGLADFILGWRYLAITEERTLPNQGKS